VVQALTDNLRQTIRKLTQRPRFVRKLTHRPSGGGRWVSSRWQLFNHCRRGLTHPGSPSKRRPDTSARPGHDWTQAPPKRTTTGRKHPPETTPTEHKHEPQRPNNPRMPQETQGNSTRTRGEAPGNPKKPQELPRTQQAPRGGSSKPQQPQMPPGSPRKPQKAPRRPQEAPGAPGAPECPKKPASTKRPSKRHASTRPAHTTPVKKTTGHERPPRPRLLDASTPQTDDNWAQAPARNHNYWTRAPTTTTKTPQDRGPRKPPGSPRKPP